jgi:FAD/FMN-containing dehydrogenase
MPAMIENTTLRELARRVDGPVLRPGEDDYDEARTLFNAMIDRRPAAIVQCTSPADVAATVAAARGAAVPLAVRGGGHSVAGMSLCDGGLVADLRPLDEVSVDPARRLGRVGGGATWATVDRATQEHGLAAVGGRVSTTGVAGLTLGGGSGWLERRFGLACDLLEAVELVTAAGDVITATADDHPDLFWALHGGGGNFGVATALTFRLQPVGPQVLAGLLLHRGEEGAAALRHVRDVMLDAPDELGTAFAWITAPAEDDVPAHLHDERIAVTIVCWSGDDLEEGERIIAPLRATGVEADLVEPVAYADFQCSIDDPPGYRNWWTAEHLDAMPDEAIDAIAEISMTMPKGPTQAFLVPWGGAVGRQGGEWPLARRDAAWVVHPFALWEGAERDAEHIAWARGLAAVAKPYASGGVYLNFTGDEGPSRIQAAFGEDNLRRLIDVKLRYDPSNVFRLNHNIAPARPAAVPA